MARVLITRISSFGDVVMLVPVVFSVAAKHPQDRFVVLTRKSFAPLFENLGFNINAKTFDANKHSGFWGVLRLLRGLSNYGYSHVADVHDVLRTKIIRTYMSILGKKVAYIDKNRAQKQLMISTKKLTPPLKQTAERYMEVFEQLGFGSEMIFKNFFEFDDRSLYPLRTIVKEKQGQWIGIAPFSKHKEKIYPLDRMENVLSQLVKLPSISIFLFGAGAEERAILKKWEAKYPNTINVSGKINLINELLLISYLDVMVSMDSANMHLASIVETPAVSIWGATHPNMGFYGFNQDPDNAIQYNIKCRPCSVYGEIPCARGDYACLKNIKESIIVDRVKFILDSKKNNRNIE